MLRTQFLPVRRGKNEVAKKEELTLPLPPSSHHYPPTTPCNTSLSNQISFIGLRSSKDHHKRPSGVVEVSGKGHISVRFLRGQCVLREWIVG